MSNKVPTYLKYHSNDNELFKSKVGTSCVIGIPALGSPVNSLNKTEVSIIIFIL